MISHGVSALKNIYRQYRLGRYLDYTYITKRLRTIHALCNKYALYKNNINDLFINALLKAYKCIQWNVI